MDYGLGVIPWSPLHGGLLGGIIRKTEQGKRRLTGRAKDALKENRKAIKAWEDLCDELGEKPGRRRARPGCWHQPASPRRSSDRAPWSSSTARSGR